MAHLSYEIQELINQVQLQLNNDPLNDELTSKFNSLTELQEKVQGKEWEENFQGYVEAKAKLAEAKKEAEKQLNGLSNLAESIQKTADAIDKVVELLSMVV